MPTQASSDIILIRKAIKKLVQVNLPQLNGISDSITDAALTTIIKERDLNQVNNANLIAERDYWLVSCER